MRHKPPSVQYDELTSIGALEFRAIGKTIRLNLNKPTVVYSSNLFVDYLSSLLENGTIDELGYILGDPADTENIDNLNLISEKLPISELNLVVNIFSGLSDQSLTSFRSICRYITARSPFSDGFFSWAYDQNSDKFVGIADEFGWSDRYQVFQIQRFQDRKGLIQLSLEYLNWVELIVTFLWLIQYK